MVVGAQWCQYIRSRSGRCIDVQCPVLLPKIYICKYIHAWTRWYVMRIAWIKREGDLIMFFKMCVGVPGSAQWASWNGSAASETGWHAETERAGANCAERCPEGGGVHAWPGDGNSSTTIQPRHGETTNKHGTSFTGIHPQPNAVSFNDMRSESFETSAINPKHILSIFACLINLVNRLIKVTSKLVWAI